MKNLTSIAIACLFILSFSSCTSYQIITLQSSLEQPPQGGFLFENDTISVSYTFNGNNCPLNINIFNRINKPLYVNWDQSSVIINNESFPLNPAQSKVNINYSEVTTKFRYYDVTDGGGEGTIWQNDRSGFIPPQSHVTIEGLSIWDKKISLNGNEEKISFIDRNNSKNTLYQYNKENSPLEFRCYITYSCTPEKEWNNLDHAFWIQNFYKCVDCSLPNEANTFYISSITGAGATIGVLALVGLSVAAVALDTP
nr:hypothetical protein [uncultured Carboxylicivirga sp.]